MFELCDIVREYIGAQQQTELTVEQLTEASLVQPRKPNPEYVSGPDLVMQHLDNKIAAERGNSEGDAEITVLGDFIREWRVLFYESVRPRYLPNGWSVDAPVVCDSA